MFNMKGEIQVRTTKEGKEYEVLALYMTTASGEVLKVHEIYIKDTLKSIMEYIAKDKK